MNNKDELFSIGICYYFPQKEIIDNVKGCIPLQLGFSETGVDMGIQLDNDGDNRSDKHQLYSELTGIYWIWKNTNSNYKGIFHHRRAFSSESINMISLFKEKLKSVVLSLVNIFFYHPSNYEMVDICHSNEEYENKLYSFTISLEKWIDQGYSIFVTYPVHYINTDIRSNFYGAITKVLFSSTVKAIKRDYPEYYPFFIDTWYGQKLYYANMSIMKANLYDEYCSFIFDILDCVEKDLISNSYYKDLTNEKALYRSFGYIGEILLNAFVLKKQKEGEKTKCCKMLFNECLIGQESIQK